MSKNEFLFQSDLIYVRRVRKPKNKKCLALLVSTTLCVTYNDANIMI